MNPVISFLSDLIFPNRCPCCNEFISWNKLVCEKCINMLNMAQYCTKCGNSKCICQNGIYNDSAFVMYQYEGATQCGILAYKSGENRNFLHYMSKQIAQELKRNNIKADYVVFAPMSKKSKLKRRFDHTKIMAKAIAKAAGCKTLNALACSNSIQSQHKLDAKMREKNMEHITIKDVYLEGKTVIFCDDITTTGSTMQRCCKLLKQQGAKTIYCAFGAGTPINSKGN